MRVIVVCHLLRELDEEHRRWKHRPLRNYPYLVVDGLWVKVKVGGRKQKMVVLFALIMINKTKKDTPYMLFTQNS